MTDTENSAKARFTHAIQLWIMNDEGPYHTAQDIVNGYKWPDAGDYCHLVSPVTFGSGESSSFVMLLDDYDEDADELEVQETGTIPQDRSMIAPGQIQPSYSRAGDVLKDWIEEMIDMDVTPLIGETFAQHVAADLLTLAIAFIDWTELARIIDEK